MQGFENLLGIKIRFLYEAISSFQHSLFVFQTKELKQMLQSGLNLFETESYILTNYLYTMSGLCNFADHY